VKAGKQAKKSKSWKKISNHLRECMRKKRKHRPKINLLLLNNLERVDLDLPCC